MLDTLQKPEVDLDLLLVPVIFANGEDSDSAGLNAAVRNERVLFDDRIWEPGEEIVIHDRTLLIDRPVDARAPPGGRVIHITKCLILSSPKG